MAKLLSSIVYFRSMAIIFIVISHVYYHFFTVKNAEYFEVFILNIVSGATAFFVFVSGYMFHHVYYHKFSFVVFVWGKVKTVLIPYILISIFSIMLFRIKADEPSDVLAYVSKMLLTGELYPAYWYVPFITLTFACSGLHFRFISLPNMTQLSIISAMLVIAILVHRPVENLNAFHSLVFFSPVYLIGIYCSVHREEFLRAVRGREFYLLGVALLVAAVQTAAGYAGNFHKPFFSYGGVDLMILQKILSALALLAVLERYSGFSSASLRLISETSFAIFFIHLIVLELLPNLGIFPIANEPWTDLFLATSFVMATSVGIALAMKRILGPNSRYAIGY